MYQHFFIATKVVFFVKQLLTITNIFFTRIMRVHRGGIIKKILCHTLD